MTEIILASASPRRRELLQQIGVSFQSYATDIDETPFDGEAAEDYVRRVTRQKAHHAQKSLKTGLPILSADTAVILNGKIMGKPESQEHAMQMLSDLSGQTHHVYSAVSLLTTEHYQRLCATEVQFKTISVQEMIAYWHSGEPIDKAGGYAIQGLGAVFVQAIRGSYSGVMGLPLFETAELLREIAIKLPDTTKTT